MGWHHEECEGKCLACLIEALVREHYGTQGLDFLRRKVGAGETAKKCEHKNRECTYESDDGEFERWQCKDCGERWGVEIAQ